MKFYTGIGARKTPIDILALMSSISRKLEIEGWTLRSGGAFGADSSFADGVKEKAEIWLPRSNFVKNPNPKHTYKVVKTDDVEAYESVTKYHPNPKALGAFSFQLMARNYRQLVGLNNPNSKFVICWTPDGQLCGGQHKH